MSRFRFLALLVLAFEATVAVQDELAWTRKRWADHTLEFPWVAFKEQALRVEKRGMTTLEGPYDNLPERYRAAEAKSEPLHADVLELSTVLEVTDEEEALGALSCRTCQLLLRRLWHGLVAWVDGTGAVPEGPAVEAYATQLCQTEVPVTLLKDWALLSSRTRRTLPTREQSLRAAEESRARYLLTQRHGQHATQPEIQLERQACLALVQGSSEAGFVAEVVAELGRYRAQFGEDADIGSQDEKDFSQLASGPTVDEQCIDRHPQCQMWAQRGECEANPVYMVGRTGTKEGNCRPACGLCTPAEPPAPKFRDARGAAAAEALAVAARQGLSAVMRRACVAATPCNALEGAEAARAVEAAVAGAWEGAPGRSGGASTSELAHSRVIMTREAQDPLVAEAPGMLGARPVPKPPTRFAVLDAEGRNDDARAAASALADALFAALGNKCLYVSTGWWLYEVCPGWRVMQFHLSEQRTPDWVISLGWAEAAERPGVAAWRRVTLPAGASPLPSAARGPAPALEMSLGAGSGCTTGEGAREEDSAPRRAVLRALCSPDAETHITVEEPETCRYEVHVYAPELCAALGAAVEGPEYGAETEDEDLEDEDLDAMDEAAFLAGDLDEDGLGLEIGGVHFEL